MSRQTNLDRLARLHDDDLDAVVTTVESALMLGDGWLQRNEEGRLRSRETMNIVITERVAE